MFGHVAELVHESRDGIRGTAPRAPIAVLLRHLPEHARELARTLGVGALGMARGHRGEESGGRRAVPDTPPPRQSLPHGLVSLRWPAAPEGTQAQVNAPRAPGHARATGPPGPPPAELGARAFVRAWGNTQLGLGVLAGRVGDPRIRPHELGTSVGLPIVQQLGKPPP